MMTQDAVYKRIWYLSKRGMHPYCAECKRPMPLLPAGCEPGETVVYSKGRHGEVFMHLACYNRVYRGGKNG